MRPPGYASALDAKGLNPPYCMWCVHAALQEGTAREVCRRYGALVSLYSTCADFEKRGASGAPVLGDLEILASHPGGLVDLTR